MIPLPHGTHTNTAREQQHLLHNHHNNYNGRGREEESKRESRTRQVQADNEEKDDARNSKTRSVRSCKGSEWCERYLNTSLTKQQPKLVSDASRQPGELYCNFQGDQRHMQQPAGSREGTEQHGRWLLWRHDPQCFAMMQQASDRCFACLVAAR